MDTDFPIENSQVAATFATWSEDLRRMAYAIRAMIFDEAQQTLGVGRLEETLKWGQPAYLTPETKSGSTIRLGLPKTGGVAIYTHCQSSIISDFQALAPEGLKIEGNRGVHFAAGAPLPEDAIRLLIRGALTYHQKKR